MSEKQTENNIDEIFRKGIEPLNTEPSDDFWRKTAEGIIQNGKAPNNKNASRWRGVALILGVSLFLLGYFTIRMQNQLNSTTLKSAEIKNQSVPNPNTKSIGINNTNIPGDTNRVISSESNNQIVNKQALESKAKVNNEVSNTPAFTKTNVTTSRIKNSRTWIARAGKHTHHSKANKSESKKTATNAPAEDIILTQGNKETTSQNPEVSTNSTGNPEPKLANTIPTIHVENANTTSPVIKDKTIQPKTFAAIDSSKKMQATDSVPFNCESSFSISAYFSPDILSGYSLRTNGTSGSQYQSAIKTGEKQNFSYSTGLKLEYMLSKRFSILTGLVYQSFSFQIAPMYLYAQKQSDGQIGYSIVSSSGVIDCPYYGSANLGDSLKMTATSTRSYLNIPFQLKYFAVKTKKLEVFIEGGAGINFSAQTKTEMNWQDSWQGHGTANVSGVEGLQNIYYSYSAGVALDYCISRHFSLYFEPTVQGAITPINKSVPVISYPYLLGLNAGVTYHF